MRWWHGLLDQQHTRRQQVFRAHTNRNYVHTRKQESGNWASFFFRSNFSECRVMCTRLLLFRALTNHLSTGPRGTVCLNLVFVTMVHCKRRWFQLPKYSDFGASDQTGDTGLILEGTISSQFSCQASRSTRELLINIWTLYKRQDSFSFRKKRASTHARPSSAHAYFVMPPLSALRFKKKPPGESGL